MKIRQSRVRNANRLLVWIAKRGYLSGKRLNEEIIDPYSEETGITPYEVWRAWDMLKEAGRCQNHSCWRWEILSKETVICLEDGSVS